MERTLIILKPDAVQRGVIGEIISRFERAGLKIVAAKMIRPDYDQFYHHYEGISKMVSRRGDKAFKVTLELMQSGPVVAIVLEGLSAVSLVRKMVGDTEPQKALPGTIRGDYAHMGFSHADKAGVGVPNIVHASGEISEAEAEIDHWFSNSELFEYATVAEGFTSPTNKAKK